LGHQNGGHVDDVNEVEEPGGLLVVVFVAEPARVGVEIEKLIKADEVGDLLLFCLQLLLHLRCDGHPALIDIISSNTDVMISR